MAAPFQALPLGVYFKPSPADCLRSYLRPWIAGLPPSTDRVIHGVDLYSDNPAALLMGLEPGFSRGFEYKWMLLAHCPRQGGGRSRGHGRMKRDVATGGYWHVEQSTKSVGGDVDDRRSINAFYTASNVGGGKGRKGGGVKTPWLMEELTVPDEEADIVGGSTVPVFCHLYVSPRASKEEKLLILGEERTPFDRHGNPKPVKVVLPDDLFDKAFDVIHGAQPPPPPPWSAPRVPEQQHRRAEQPPVVPEHHHHHHGLAMLPRGVLAAPPRSLVGPEHLRHHHGHAVLPLPLPLGVLAAPPQPLFAPHHHHHGHAVLSRGALAGPPRPLLGPDQHYHQHGVPLGLGLLAAPPHYFGGPGQFYGGPPSGFLSALPHAQTVDGGYFISVQPPRQHMFASSPGPLQGEEGIHVRKKQRLGGADSETSCFIVHDDDECSNKDAVASFFRGKESVPTPSARHKITGMVAVASPAPTVLSEPTTSDSASGDCNILDLEDFLIQSALESRLQPRFDHFPLEDFPDFSDLDFRFDKDSV